MTALLTTVFLIALVGSPLEAQIYEWRDASGSRNYTNDIEDVPEALRDAARVVVRAPKAVAPALEAVASSPEPVKVANVDPDREGRRAERERRRAEMARWRAEREQLRIEREAAKGAQVVYDDSFRFTRQEPAPAPPQVNINIEGPLSVSQVIVPQPQPPVYVDPAYDLVYEPYVSTAFDRGRFRHRTVRMRLQDQFQYDRNGPSLYLAGPIPLGPRFQAKLPRGVRSCSTNRSRGKFVLRR